MKTAGRHHVNTTQARSKNDKRVQATEPDRIIMPVHVAHGSSEQFYRGLKSMDYTEFEEVQASSDYDEIAFQEFAEEDPTRLRVADR